MPTPSGPGGRRLTRWVCAGLLALTPLAVRHDAAAAVRDVTADVLAGRDVALTGDVVVRVPAGRHVYDGAFSGTGTITFDGSGTLVLTRDSDITVPASRRTQRLVRRGGNHPWWRVVDPDPPAVVVRRGVRVEYGAGGAGFIGHYPWTTPGTTLNALNIRVDGALVLPTDRRRHLGILSGTGLVVQPRFTWPGIDLAGDHPFSGVLANGTGATYGAPSFSTSMPNLRTVLNEGTFQLDTPFDERTVVRADFWSRQWGSDVNFYSRGAGTVVVTGVYSWADGGPDTAPTLSDPKLNSVPQPHRANGRGINIQGARVQFGDGTTSRFFLPGTPETTYVNMLARRSRSLLRFAYAGPVTLGTTISGGQFRNTLLAPGEGDVVIVGTRGNDVTFAAPQNYHGSTTVERGAVLRLGSGRAGGDTSLLTSRPGDRLVVDGTLVAANRRTPLLLTRVSGGGGVTQAGPAPLTVTGRLGWTGPTTVRGGTLAVRGGSLSGTSGVRLTTAGARLDLTAAADAALPALDVARGTSVDAGARPVVVRGAVTGAGTVTGALRTAGVTGPDGVLTVKGGWTQTAGGVLRIHTPDDMLQVTGPVTLAGRLDVAPAAAGEDLVVVRIDGTRPVTGTFEGLAEGATVRAGTTTYHLTYTGGDGNDVVLQLAGPTTTSPARTATRSGSMVDAGGAAVQDGRTDVSAKTATVGVTAAVAVAAAGLFLALRRSAHRAHGARRKRTRAAGRAGRDRS